MKINIPNLLKASSPELLREAMLMKTLETRLDIKYFDLQFDGKDWVCWYYEALDFTALYEGLEAKKAKKK